MRAQFFFYGIFLFLVGIVNLIQWIYFDLADTCLSSIYIGYTGFFIFFTFSVELHSFGFLYLANPEKRLNPFWKTFLLLENGMILCVCFILMMVESSLCYPSPDPKIEYSYVMLMFNSLASGLNVLILLLDLRHQQIFRSRDVSFYDDL